MNCLEQNSLPSKNSLKNLFEKREQLHLKVQQMVSQWTKLSEIAVGIDDRKDRPLKDDALMSKRRMLTGTLVLGCLAALYVTGIESFLQIRPFMLRLSIWLGLGVYGVLLCHWHHQPFLDGLLLPLWIGFSSAWISMTVTAYLFLTMGILIWICSGLTSERSCSPKRLGLNFLINYGSVALIVWFLDLAVISAAWGVLIFFGLQCTHFLLSSDPFNLKLSELSVSNAN